MKNINLYISIIVSIFTLTSYTAQTTAMNFSGIDCNGNNVDLFQDLDAGKSVVLFFYMPSCGTCPPEALKIQTMANNINAVQPGKVKAYAFPYQNSTTCSYSSGWVTTNGLPLYIPMDSGAAQVAYYGGFGMPTVVLLGGGSNHSVQFVTQNFVTSDTTTMHNLIVGTAGIETKKGSSFDVFPNPANQDFKLILESKLNGYFNLVDVNGKNVPFKVSESNNGLEFYFEIKNVPNGNYFLHINSNGEVVTKQISVLH